MSDLSETPRVMLVDPDPRIWAGLPELLSESGVTVSCLESFEEAIAALSKEAFDMVLADVDEVGTAFLGRARRSSGDPLVVLCDTFGTPEEGADLLEAGAFDFLPRPVSPDHAAACVSRGLRQRQLQAENRRLRTNDAAERRFANLESRDPRMVELFELVEAVADSDVSVLIEGESGTGKTRLARALHASSTRSAGPFIEVNCGAIPENLLESELFGHSKGAFTGADRNRQGKFEAADGGTLFLDEIATASADLQVKLLRVLESRRFERVGENETRDADVRLVAATNRKLADEVAAGRFREDLMYRIQVVTLEVPPLRDRIGDVALLSRRFAERFAREFGRGDRDFTERAFQALMQHTWPGNVRELEHAVQRSVLLARGSRIDLEDLPPELTGGATGAVEDAALAADDPPLGPLKEMLAVPERRFLCRALEATGGNRTEAADLLGITRSTLFNKMRRHGLLDFGPDGRSRRE
ncbi:MAG: sigma-54 dependent transcriptional regulator [Planctomycetota bacterium]